MFPVLSRKITINPENNVVNVYLNVLLHGCNEVIFLQVGLTEFKKTNYMKKVLFIESTVSPIAFGGFHSLQKPVVSSSYVS